MLQEPRRTIQVVAGPRQVGKTTSVLAHSCRTFTRNAMPLEDFFNGDIESLL